MSAENATWPPVCMAEVPAHSESFEAPVHSGSHCQALPGPVVCICGPTASGKSALAEEVALALSTGIISVDAMQVYRGMDIGTAKAPIACRRVPLEMVDVAEVGQDYSAALFQHDARALIDEQLARSQIPVLCGGTGLYLNAVIDEMNFPAGLSGDSLRAHYEHLATVQGSQATWELLRERDPASAALIHPHNVRRVVRALELLDLGTSYAERAQGVRRQAPHYAARIWGLARERARLYARIDARVDEMVEAGLVEEVRALAEQGLRDAPTARQAIGYKELLGVCEGRLSQADAIALIKRRSRRYAKRQLSWLRRDTRVRWLDMDVLSIDEACTLILEDLHTSKRRAIGEVREIPAQETHGTL